MKKISILFLLAVSVIYAEAQQKALVAYFSFTNNTKAYAEKIVTMTGGDLYEIVPQVAYGSENSNYYDQTTRAYQEQYNTGGEQRPAIQTTLVNAEQYDIIFLGSPIWYGKSPRVILTFLDTYGFTGKTIVPFVTSGSSGIDLVNTELSGTFPNINWLEGKRLNGISDANLRTWVEACTNASGGEGYGTLLDSGKCGSNLTWEYYSSGVLKIIGTGGLYNYNLGGPPWWDYHESITTIILPDGLTATGVDVFVNCNITSISIPETVIDIEEEAFSGCKLTSLSIPKNVDNIYAGAFSYCEQLTSITCNAVTPPAMYSAQRWDNTAIVEVFKNVDKNIPLYVPKGSEKAYKHADQWKDFAHIRAIGETEDYIDTEEQSTGYTITVTANNDAWGSVFGGGTYKAGEEAILTAIPVEGYIFSTWNDGNTDNPRLVTVLSDSIFTAIFVENNTVPAGKRAIYLNTGGHWWGNSYNYYIHAWQYENYPETVKFEYVADYLYRAYIDKDCTDAYIFYIYDNSPFTSIEDIWEGDKSKTKIPADKDMYIITSSYMGVWSAVEYGEWGVYDAKKSEESYAYGSCGVKVEYAVKRSTNTLVISGTGDMDHYATSYSEEDPRWYWAPWEGWTNFITALSLSEGLTTIGAYSFELCPNITTVTIPSTVTAIGTGAFNAKKFTSITCNATMPPKMVESSKTSTTKHIFQNADFSIPLYVPSGSVAAYKKADYWKDFKNIRSIDGGEEEGGEEGGNETPENAIALDVDAIEFDYYPSYNPTDGYDYSLFVYNNDASAKYLPQLVLDIQTTTHKSFAGEYSAAKGNMVLKYCNLYLPASNEDGYEQLALTDAYCTVTMSGDLYTVRGYVTASNGKAYSFNVTAEADYVDAEHRYEPETPQTLDFTIQSADIDLEEIEQGLIWVEFTTSDEGEIYLLFKTENKEAKTIADGVYSFTNNSYESFLAGYSGNNSYYNSLAIINGNVYYLTDGTVTVGTATIGKYFDVNATSFYGTKFKFTYLIENGDNPGETITTITCSQALDYAASLAKNETGTTTYNIIGYVTSIIYNDFNTEYNNMTFWIADSNNSASSNEEGAFYVYRGKPDVELKVGDKVQVTTKLKNYYDIIESETSATVTRLSSATPDPDPDPGSTTEYTIKVVANDTRLGSVYGGGTYEAGEKVTLTATAKSGAKFDKWTDGVTSASRTVTVSSDATYTAVFKAVASSNEGKVADEYNRFDEKSGVYEPAAKEIKKLPDGPASQKILWDGHIYILIEDKVYDAHGRRVK